MRITIYLTLVLGFLAMSCGNKVDGVRLDEELAPHYEAFKIEAAARGVTFDNSDEEIEGYIQNIFQNGVIGACTRNDDNDRNPSIFLDEDYWETATDNEREYVVFHELGHCFLLRDHRNDVDSSNVCVSIMASGVSGCINNYNSETRDELLDELFSF